VLETFVGAKPLLNKLLLQMENYVKDNKNWHLLVFLSLLIARRCFKRCNWGSLLLVTCTRTWSFGYLSKKLREQNNCVGKLDENFYGFVGMAVHPPTNTRNFWFQILGLCLFEGWPLNVSRTYIYAYLCIFWVASDAVQGVVNKYDVDGLAIWLWTFNNQGCPKLWSWILNLVPFHPIWGDDASKSIEKEKFISNSISKYLEFWKLNIVWFHFPISPILEY
jgi:hypothetical protein